MTEQLITTSVPPATRRLMWQVGVATLCRLFINTSRRFPYPFAPAMSRGLGVPLEAITSLIAVNQATGIISPLFGPLSDRLGYRVMMLLGLGMMTVGMISVGFLPFYGVVMLALFLAGLGKSIFDPTLQAYLGQRVPYQRRGLVIGVVEFGWAGASLLGVPLVGVLIDRLGWQSPFWVLGGLGLFCLAALAVLIPAEDGQPLAAQHRVGFQTAWRQVSGSHAALGALGFSFLAALANDNLFIIYGVWLEQSFALGVVALGLATTVIGLAELIGEGLTASIADKIGLKRAIFGGLFVSALSYMALPLIAQTLPLALAGLFLIFLTFEFSVVTAISLFTEILPEARATMMSAAIAAMSLGRVAAAMLGPLIWAGGGLLTTGLVSGVVTLLALACVVWGLRGWRR